MNFDKTELTDIRAKNWMNYHLTLQKSLAEDEDIIEEYRENGWEMRKSEDIKPEMPWSSDADEGGFDCYEELKYLASENNLICFRHYGFEDLMAVGDYPETLQGWAALVQHLLGEYDRRVREIADYEPMDAVRKTLLFTAPGLVHLLEREGKDPWQWAGTAITADTLFEKVNRTESTQKQKKIDRIYRDKVLRMYSSRDSVPRLRETLMQLLETAFNSELVPGYWNDRRALDEIRDEKLEEMQVFGDLSKVVEAF